MNLTSVPAGGHFLLFCFPQRQQQTPYLLSPLWSLLSEAAQVLQRPTQSWYSSTASSVLSAQIDAASSTSVKLSPALWVFLPTSSFHEFIQHKLRLDIWVWQWLWIFYLCYCLKNIVGDMDFSTTLQIAELIWDLLGLLTILV